jgi:YVTN family beta-propeller protein
MLATAGIALAAIAGAAFLVTRNSAGGLSRVDPNHVGVIDAGSNEVVAAIPVGIRPGPIAAASRGVWVGNLGDRTLTRIDPRELVPTATLSLDHRTPSALAAGSRAVWVLHGGSGRLARVEQQFGRVSVTTRVTDRPYTDASGGVALDGTTVWVVFGDSTLARVQEPSGAVTGRGLAGSVPSAVAVGGRAVWVANSGAAMVQRFDPETFDQGPIRTLAVGRRPAAMAFGEGALWVANRGDDSVTRIEPSTGASSTIRVGDEPAGIATGAGAVWVANSADGTVSRIDPEDERVTDTIELGSSPAGVAVAGELVWVSAQAP